MICSKYSQKIDFGQIVKVVIEKDNTLKLIEGKDKTITYKNNQVNTKKIINPVQNSLFNSNLSRENILKNQLFYNGTNEDSNSNKNNRNEFISLLNVNNIRCKLRNSNRIFNNELKDDTQNDYLEDNIKNVNVNKISSKVKIGKVLGDYKRIRIKEENFKGNLILGYNEIEESQSELKSINT